LITAAILLIIVVCIIFFTPPLVFQVVAALVLLAATWEWSGLLGERKSPLVRILMLVLVALAYLEVFFFVLPLWTLLAGGVMVLWGLAAVIAYNCGAKPTGFQYPLLKVLACLLLIVPTMIALFELRMSHLGPGFVFFALTLAFVNDSAAYFCGRWIGKTKLAPQVSPKKTWEGCVGGIVAGVIWAIVVTAIFWSDQVSIGSMVIVAIPTLIAAVIGDLFISVLKRQIDLKDTGSLLPGHGGLLDRIDAVIMAIPVFALMAIWVGVI